MKFSVCADIMYNDMSFEDKIVNIKNSGFDTIEFWGWSNKDILKIKKTIQKNNMKVSCFCLDSKNTNTMNKIGKYMLNSGDMEELRAISEETIFVAKELGADALITTVGDDVEGVSYDNQIKNIKESLNYIKQIFEENKITLLVEPINRQERENYLTPNVKTVIDIVKDVDSEYIKVLYDVYHQAMECDFSISEMIDVVPYIGHIHIADVPGRNEPGTGTIDYKAVFKALKDNGYTGYIGAEFMAKTDERTAFEALRNI